MFSLCVFLLILVTSTGQVLSTLIQDRTSIENVSRQSQPILEVILFCNGGACPEKGNKASLRIYEDHIAEYLVFYSCYLLPHANDKVQLKKSTKLSDNEFKELINLVEPTKMLADKAEYYPGYFLSCVTWSRAIIYRTGDRNKTIFLYYNKKDRKPTDLPPDWLKDFIERADELGGNIQKMN